MPMHLKINEAGTRNLLKIDSVILYSPQNFSKSSDIFDSLALTSALASAEGRPFSAQHEA